MAAARRHTVAAMGMVALLAACGTASSEPDVTPGVRQYAPHTLLGDLQEKGEIVIGVKYDVPPFGVETESGVIEGFDVDLGTLIADELGVKPKFVQAISDNRVPFLQDGTVDLILSTMTITTDHDANITFSNPYYVAHGRIAVMEGSDIQGTEDLDDATVCTARGSTYATGIIPKVAPDATVRIVDKYSECLELLLRGSVDAEITDDVILAGQAAQDDRVVLVGEDLSTDPYGVAIPDLQPEMKVFVDQVLADAFESGRWRALYDKWVGSVTGEEPSDPSEWTLAEALANYPCVETC